MSALSHKAKENAIVVVEDITLDAPKTKTFIECMKALNTDGKKILFVMPEYNDNVVFELSVMFHIVMAVY